MLDRLAAGVRHRRRPREVRRRVRAGPDRRGLRSFLAKPMAFMNRSGPPVRSLAEFFRISRQEVLVIHDDIDLALRALKNKRERRAWRTQWHTVGDRCLRRGRFRAPAGGHRAFRDAGSDVADYVLDQFDAG
ncbi:MAG: hypothetical protein MZV70_20425 [Desulfobacterales bacterium]|nr:hypothetical protein [Desulfobacterales bacterium]